MRTRPATLVLALIALPSLARHAQAIEPPAPPPAHEPGVNPALELEIDLAAWIPRLGGTTQLGGAPIDLASDLDLDSMEVAPNIELTLRRGGFTLFGGGFGFETSASGTASQPLAFGAVSLAPGDAFAANVEMTAGGLELGIDVWHPVGAGCTDESDEVDLRFALTLGGRVVDVDQSLSSASATASAGGEWLGLYGGIGMRLDWAPEGGLPLGHGLIVEGTFGLGPALGGDGGVMWHVRAGLTWEVVPNVGVMLGYRLLELDVEDGDYLFDAGLQGLALGASIRF